MLLCLNQYQLTEFYTKFGTDNFHLNPKPKQGKHINYFHYQFVTVVPDAMQKL